MSSSLDNLWQFDVGFKPLSEAWDRFSEAWVQIEYERRGQDISADDIAQSKRIADEEFLALEMSINGFETFLQELQISGEVGPFAFKYSLCSG